MANWQNPGICSGNGLAPNRRQTINWINADSVHWRIYAASGGGALKAFGSFQRTDNVIQDGRQDRAKYRGISSLNVGDRWNCFWNCFRCNPYMAPLYSNLFKMTSYKFMMRRQTLTIPWSPKRQTPNKSLFNIHVGQKDKHNSQTLPGRENFFLICELWAIFHEALSLC